MAVVTRDILLILRARDEASRAVSSLVRSMDKLDRKTRDAIIAQQQRGKVLTSVAVGIGTVGAAGIKVMFDLTQEAAGYNQEAAKTLTQLDKQKGSLADIKKIGMEVAAAIPAPFESMQRTLFDIFSSMDVNIKDSKHLLTEFSKASVAGQEDLQNAARGTIGILNAYRLGAQGVNRVNDVMFQLVRKGVGTYGEFARTIGRAVPSAVRAGQSIEDLAGMLAFLTRNGLSAAMAAASAARALDAISHPETVKRLHKMGIEVKDSSGNFREMSAIMVELGAALNKLPPAERVATLQAIFKGSGGTIQARRFFDIAVKNSRELVNLTTSMKQSKGAMEQAYNIMFKQPQSQMQLLTNRWQILRVEIGEALIPVLMQLVTWLNNIFDWFNNLSPEVKKFIGITGALAAGLSVLAAIVTAVAGGLLLLGSAAATLGIGLGALSLIIGGVVLAIAAVAAGAYLVIKNWDSIVKFFKFLWNVIKDIFLGTLNVILESWKFTFKMIFTVLRVAYKTIEFLIKLIAAIIMTPIILAYNILKGIFQVFWKWAGDFIMKVLKSIGSIIKSGWDFITAIFRFTFSVLKALVSGLWNWLKGIFKSGSNAIKDIWNIGWTVISNFARGKLNSMKDKFSEFWSSLKKGFRNAVDTVVGIWKSLTRPLLGPVNFLIEWVWNKGIAKAWNTAVNIVGLKKLQAPMIAPIKYAQGGLVYGRGGPRDDANLALLSNREFVVNARSTKQFLPLLEAINSGGLPALKDGGILGKFKSGFGSVLGTVGRWAGKGAAFVLEKLFSPIKSMIGSFFRGSNWKELVGGIPIGAMNKMLSWMRGNGGVGGTSLGRRGLEIAKRYLGTPYVWGGWEPGGFDCSGLMYWVYKMLLGVKGIPRVSQAQQAWATPISAAQAAAGDLVFFGRPATHVGMFARPGVMLNAPFTGARVRYDPIGNATSFGRVHDQGGWLEPGLNIAINKTGRREKTLSPRQTDEWLRGNGTTINVYTQEIDPRMHAAQLGWELDRRAS